MHIIRLTLPRLTFRDRENGRGREGGLSLKDDEILDICEIAKSRTLPDSLFRPRLRNARVRSANKRTAPHILAYESSLVYLPA